MGNTNWQTKTNGPATDYHGKNYAQHVNAVQAAINQLQSILSITTAAATEDALTADTTISGYRLWTATNKNWTSAATTIEKYNGSTWDTITAGVYGFTIDYAGGAIYFHSDQLVTDQFRATYTYLTAGTGLITAAGSLLVGSGAGVLAEFLKGTARQALLMNSGATALEWATSLQSLLTTQGDVPYASAANTPARLAKGTVAEQVLQMNAALTAPEWGNTIQQRNIGTNMGFEVWQRGAGPFTSHNVYTADRWIMEVLGTSTQQIDREGTIKKTNSLYSLKSTFVKGTADCALYQKLVISDGYHYLLGKTISLRIPVYSNAASAIKSWVGGDGTGATTIYSSYHAGDSAWADLDAVSYAVPSDATYINIGVYFYATTTSYIDNAMLVIGSKAADYAPLHPAEEMQKCQRYYEVHGGANDVFPQILTSANGAHAVGVSVPFNVKKAVTPTLTVNGTWTATNCGQPTADKQSTEGYVLRVTASAAGAVVSAPNGADDTITIEANP